MFCRGESQILRIDLVGCMFINHTELDFSSNENKFRELSSLDLNDYESERQKFLAEGGCPCKIASGIFSRFFHFHTHQSPPSTFSLLRPNASNNAAIARYCSRSCKRNFFQVVATRFLTPLMGRLFSDWDHLFHFCKNSRK